MKKIFTFFLIVISSIGFSQAPTFQWVKNFMGPQNLLSSQDLAIDKYGNSYTIGYFNDTIDFDPGIGVSNLIAVWEDVFITKLDPAGNFVWAKSFGGKNSDRGGAIDVDSLGFIYASGTFKDTADFDPGVGVSNLINYGIQDAFILKLDNNGNFVWAKQITGSQIACHDIKVDSNKNVYVTGAFTSSAYFEPTVSNFSLTANYRDVYVAKYNTSGILVWAKQVGGNLSICVGNALSIDKSDNVHVTGTFENNVDFDPGPSSFSLSSVGASDIFILKLTSLGNFINAKGIGSINYDKGSSIATDQQKNIYVSGWMFDSVNFDPGFSNTSFTSKGDDDAFIVKYDSSFKFKWVRQVGGAGNEEGTTIAINKTGSVFLGGYFSQIARFYGVPGTYTLASTTFTYTDVFFLKMDSLGNLDWFGGFGGLYQDHIYSIQTDGNNGLYSTGWVNGTNPVDFDIGPGNYYVTLNTPNNVPFVHKMGQVFSGIKEQSKVSIINLFPNPTKGQFDLILDKVKQKTEIKIFNSLGQIVLQKNISSTDKISLSISDQPSGIYFVEVNADGESFRAKVVKE